MENLLSLAFDNLSSWDGMKIRKGLRQVEGLLANICLSRQQGRDRRASIANPGHAQESPPKTLSDITEDPAFYEFFKLQEGFQWNVAVRLVSTLDRIFAKGNDGSMDLLILSCLDLLQGIMLLHPPSKTLFSREQYMNLLLDLLEPDMCPAIQSATLLTLVTSMIDCPQNTRTFEHLDGLLSVTSLFRSRETARDVKMKLIEFIYFYLMPETPSIPSARNHFSSNNNSAQQLPGLLQRSPSKLAKAFVSNSGRNDGRSRGGDEDDEDCVTRSQEEKQGLLGRHLSSVDELVKDLQSNNLFGGVVCDS
ncbi:putative cell division control protein [Xylariaceae sp. FL0255]|nr:putative cell division control protein [Xylariaceae sp. FL0255]